MKKYALYPGYMISKHDGDRHFIDAPTLARLYKVPLDECVEFQTDRHDWAESAAVGLIKLVPRYDGDYVLPPQGVSGEQDE